MKLTTVDSPWHLAGHQLRSVPRPWVLVLLVVIVLPSIALISAMGEALPKLTCYALTGLFLPLYLCGDRRIWRALGLNRLGALRQQLIITGPTLLLAAALTLPGLPPTAWPWAVVITMALLAFDALITLDLLSVGNQSRAGISMPTLNGPAARGSIAHRLIGVPMLRWSIPLGVVLGVAWILTAGHTSYPAIVLRSLALLAAVVIPVLPIQSGTASLATWQALGLPRREWSWLTSGTALAAVLLSLLSALATLGAAGLWNLVPWADISHVFPAALALAPLWTGLVLVLIAVTGKNESTGKSLFGGAGAFIATFGDSILREPGMSRPWIEVGCGVLLIALGLHLHRRLRQNTNDRRASPDNPKFTS